MFEKQKLKKIYNKIFDKNTQTCLVFLCTEIFAKEHPNTDLNTNDLGVVLTNAEIICNLFKSKVKYFKCIMLNEKYNDFLTSHNLTENIDSRIEYADSLSENEIKELWENNGGEINYITLVSPFIIFQDDLFEKNISFSLSADLISDIEKSIANSFQIDPKDVCVSKYMSNIADIEKNTEDIMDLNILKLEKNSIANLGRLETQKIHKNVNLEVECIVITLRTYTNGYMIPAPANSFIDNKIMETGIDMQYIANELQNEMIKTNLFSKELQCLPTIDKLMFANEVKEFSSMYLIALNRTLKSLGAEPIKLN